MSHHRALALAASQPHSQPILIPIWHTSCETKPILNYFIIEFIIARCCVLNLCCYPPVHVFSRNRCQDVLHSSDPNTHDETGVYSTDSNGHCFLYGPKIAGVKKGNKAYKDPAKIDVGEWLPTKKYHLRANKESPVNTTFDTYTVCTPDLHTVLL